MGPYLLEHEVARGGMGVVYRARHATLERPVALKVMRAELAGAVARERFLREAQAVARLRHPGIVAVHEVGWDGQPFIAMEWVDGESLDRRLRAGPLAPGEVVDLACALAAALEHAHAEGILHRDLKPHNVLLDRTGRARITDFGLAKDLSDAREALTRTGEVVGTPAFMPPEQAGAKGAVDGRADVYGLGATLYALVTGAPPFQGPTAINVLHAVIREAPQPPSALRPEVPRDLEAVILRCLAKAPDDRYPSMTTLREDLERLRRGSAVLAGATGLGLRRALGRRGGLALAAGASVVAVVLAAAFALTPASSGSGGPDVASVDTSSGADPPAEVATSFEPAPPEPAPPELTPPDPAATPQASPTSAIDAVVRGLGNSDEPHAREQHAMAYDAERGHVVLLGGVAESSRGRTRVPLLYAWDGVRWFCLTPAANHPTLPAARHAHAMAYDRRRGKLVLFGGKGADGLLGDLWEWDGQAWTALEPAGGPAPRAWHAMTYDPVGGRVLLHGGVVKVRGPQGRLRDGSSPELWSWDGDAWSLVDGAGPPRYRHGLAFDPTTGQALVVGGLHFGPRGRRRLQGGLWGFDAGWRRLDEDSQAARLHSAAVCFDGARLLVHGGVLTVPGAGFQIRPGTWTWADGWRPLTGEAQPPPRGRHAMAWDAGRKVAVLFGGRRHDASKRPVGRRFHSGPWELRDDVWSRAETRH
jgi:predicted Ser/Thr protein kinase